MPEIRQEFNLVVIRDASANITTLVKRSSVASHRTNALRCFARVAHSGIIIEPYAH